MSCNNDTPVIGWFKPPKARKWHYFNARGFSLCGKHTKAAEPTPFPPDEAKKFFECERILQFKIKRKVVFQIPCPKCGVAGEMALDEEAAVANWQKIERPELQEPS